MEIIYSVLDIYLNFITKFFYAIGLDKDTASVFATFTALFYPTKGIAMLWLTAGGDYAEDVDKDERFILAVMFSFMTTGMIYVLRGFGEIEMTSKYLLLGYAMSLGIALSYRYKTTVIADGIDKHDKKY